MSATGFPADRPLDTEPTRSLWRDQLLLVAVACLVFFTNLGSYALFDEDEPKNAVCGREMFERGDWIVPTFNAELRTDKPILIYWLMQVSFHLFGVSEFAARFGSSLLAVGTTLLTYHIGRMLYRAEIGLLAGLIVCTSLMFSAVGRAVTPDSVLIFCLMLAFTSYVWAVSSRRGGHFSGTGTNNRTDWTDLLPTSALMSIPMYVSMGLAILAKGPIGVLLPCTIIGLLLLVTRRNNDLANGLIHKPTGPWWRRALVTIAQVMWPSKIVVAGLKMRLLLGAFLVLIVALPWYITVGLKTNGAWLQGFLGDHNVGRFMGPKENHSGPIFYYVIVLMMGCFPWSVFLPMAVWRLARRVSNACEFSDSDRFVACWAGVWLVFFSLAGTKLPNYVLPMYPSLALITARYLREWQGWKGEYGAVAFRNSCRAMGMAGVVMMIAAPIAMSILLPGEEWLTVVGAVPLLGASLAYMACRRGERLRAIRITSVTAVVTAVLVVGIAPTRIGPHQDSPKLAESARRLSGKEHVEIGVIESFTPSLVFYAEHPVERLRKPADVSAFIKSHPEGFVVARSDRLNSLKAEVPNLVEVARHRRFLRRHDLVLLSGQQHVAVQNGSSTSTK